jgi:1-acyl-sn-glycerol-3-phosphate acyltransferase
MAQGPTARNTPEAMPAADPARLRRRALSFPLAALAALAAPGLLVAALPFALVVDAAVRRASAARGLLFLAWFALCEGLGLAAGFALWVRHRPGPARAEAAHRVQAAWTAALLGGLRVLFGLRLEVEGPPLGPGPTLVFVRHASTVDTLLPMLLARPLGLRVRYVLKAELRADPCLDLYGHWLPNAFVRRQGADGAAEVARVGALAAGMGPGEAFVLFPEGTRFRPEARAALCAAGGATASRAARFAHTLPPRPGGALAALAAAPGASLWLVGHVGLEGLRTMGDLFTRGGRPLVLRARTWAFPAGAVPREPAAALAFLDDAWAALDAWVGAPR